MNPHLTSVPPSYVAGVVELNAGKVTNLLDAIQDQLQPNCPGTAVEMQIWADSGNMGSVIVGAASHLKGPLSQDNWAYKLTASSPPRVYRSTYPGSSVPIGDLQLLSPSGGKIHIEVQL